MNLRKTSPAGSTPKGYLFTDPSGKVPTTSTPPSPVQSNYVGFAGTIQVNAAVQATPSLVRDGTAGGNSNNLAGYTGVIQNVLNYAFGADQSAGVSWPASNTSGLGVSGTLNAPYSSQSTTGDLASTLLASQAQESASISSQVDTEQTVQTNLSSKLSTESGVNMDTEMSNMIELQNAYGANARILTTMQAMFTQLLQAVQ